jgi:threonine aldolase
VCFSKGLGAPVGSALCGSRDFIKRARRFKQQYGGGANSYGYATGASGQAGFAVIGRVSRGSRSRQDARRGHSRLSRPGGDVAAVETNILRLKSLASPRASSPTARPPKGCACCRADSTASRFRT